MKFKKGLSLVLSLILVAQLCLPVGAVMANPPDTNPGAGKIVCTHHVHDEKCGYTAGTPCTFDPATCEICNPKNTVDNIVPLAVGEVYAVYNGSTFCAATEAAPSKATETVITDKKTITRLYIQGASVPSYLMQYCTALTHVDMPIATEIGDTAFSGCEKLISATMPEAISIGSNAFYGCTNLANPQLSKVRTIGNYAFYKCTALTSMAMPEATSIGDSAFKGCSSLNSAKMLKETAIGDSAFEGCKNLTSVTMTSATKIGENAFNGCTALATIELPAATTIGNYAFSGCTNLARATMPNATAIGNSAFYGCAKLTTIELPAAITITIGNDAFSGCAKLANVDMSSATSIGNRAFDSCTMLTTEKLSNATSIGSKAFNECTSLTTIELPKATEINNMAFYGCKALKSINMPVATIIGPEAFRGCTALYGCTALTGVELPKATSIGDFAFFECAKLASVAMPSATTIGDNAFIRCTALRSAAMPNVKTIGNYAFNGCTTLASLTLGATPPTTVGTGAFAGCPKTDVLTIQGNTAYETEVLAAYTAAAASDDDTTDGKWYGWTLPKSLDGTGVSTSEGKLTAAGNVKVDYGTDNIITFTASFAKTGENKLKTLVENQISLLNGKDIESKAATLANGVYSATFTVNTNAFTMGTYSYTATFDGNRSLVGGTATETVTVTINKAAQAVLNIDGVPNSVTYGDSTFTLSTTGGSGTGTAVTYAVTTGTDVVSVTSAGEVTVLKAGPATITATKAGDTNYNDKTGKVEITVQGAKPTVTWGTTAQSTTYTGSPVLASVLTAPTVTLVKGETFKGTIQYAYEKAGSSTGYTDGLPTAAGEYTIKAHIAAAGNYTAADNTNTMTLTISKSTPALAINTMTGKTYDGTAVANPTAGNMTITGAAYTDVTFAYSKNSNMSSPLAAAPKDAGTYYVQANVVAGVNTNAASSAAVSFTIAQAALTVTGGTAEPKKWDGTTTATMTALTFGGLVNGETLAITDYTVGSPAYNDANAGTNKTVTGTATLVSNAKTNNYTLTGAYTITGQTISKATGLAAPTFSAMDDENGKDTFTFTPVSGYETATLYEYSMDGGNNWTAVTVNPISVGNVAGTIKIRIKETTNYEAGAVYTHSAAFTASLTGTATISGTATYGETLTATVIGQQSDSVLSYKWLAGTTELQSGTSNTLNVPGSAVGKTITVEVTAAGYEGKLTSNATNAVAKKAVTASADTVTKVYDGSNKATVSLSITKVNSGDSITITAPNAAYDNENVGKNKAITLGTLSISGTAANWYDVTAPTNVTGTITAKVLSDATVTVGGSYTYTGTAITPTAANVTVKDGATTLANGTDYDYAASNNTIVGTATVTVTLKGNYSGTASKTFTIAKANPTYTVPTGLTAKYGQPLSAVTLTTGFSWMDGTPNVGAVGAVGAQTHKAKFTPTDTNNYNTVENIDVTVTVEKATPTVTVTAEKKVSRRRSLGNHDDTITLKATVAGVAGGTVPAGTVTFKSGTTTIASAVVVTNGVTNGVATYDWVKPDATNHTITAEFAATANTNYADATGTSAAFGIDKVEQAALSFDGVPTTATYGDNQLTFSTTGGSGNGAVDYKSTDINVVADDGTIKGIGTATITATKAGDTNYNVKTATAQITVAPATPTLTWGSATQSVTYTGSAAVITAPTATGVTGGTTPNGTISYTYEKKSSFSLFTTPESGLPVNAGTYTVTAHIAAEGNYTAADSTTMELTINKSTPTLTIGAGYTGKTYDGTAVTNPTAENMTISGTNYADVKFAYSKNSDMSSPLTVAPKNAETYYVQASVAEGINTTAASSAAVSFTITQAALTVTGGTVTQRQYNGGTDATVTALTFNGLVNGETLALTTDYTVGAPAYDTADAGTNKTVTGTATLVSNATTGNYTLTGAYTITGQTISKATGLAAPTDGTMDDTANTFTFTPASGYETATLYEYSMDGGNNWTAVTVNPISVGNVAGTIKIRIKATTNYEAGAVYTHSAAFTATLEGTVAIGGTATYGETLTATTAGTQVGAVLSYEWKAGGTVLQAKSEISTYKIAGAAVGKIVTVEVTGAGYNGKLTSTPTDVVAQKAVTATAGAVSKVYNGQTAATVSLSIAKANDGDEITVTAPSAVYNDKNVGTSKAITMGDLTITGAAANWYTVTAPTNVTGTITAKPVTVKADDKSMTTGGTPPTFTVTYTGFVGTENDSNAALTTPAVAACSADGKTAGTFDITLSTQAVLNDTIGKNYTIASQTKGTLTVSSPSSGGGTVTPPVPKPEPPKTDPGTGNTEVSVPVKPVTKGDTSSATVPEKAVSDAIATAEKEAAKTGGSASVTVTVDAPKDAKTVETTLPSKSLSAVAAGKTEGLKISTPVADLSFDSEALKNIAGMAGEDVKISATQVDAKALTDTQKSQVGDAPVFDFTVTSGDKTISNFNGGTATVSVPYTLKEGETPSFVTVWLLDDTGKLIPIEAKYTDGKIAFETGHFSRYAIGYLPFTDVKPDWAYESIVYAYQNQLFSGVGDDKFAPTHNMNRAMLWTVLYRMAGSPGKTETPANWYADAQAWAMANSISDGTNPDGNITREQLATILWRYAQSKKQDVSIGEDTNILSYDDFDQMSQYAIPALQWACGAGIITGKSDSVLDPGGNATRAQVAAMLQRYATLVK